VKNNLQVIASLLSIQARNVSDQRDVSLFEHSRDRVISMAMVHEQLHQTGDLSMIPFNAYLRDLIAHIKEAASTESIDMTVETDPIFLELYRAVPCGLIVNELVTNALEHAFDGRPSGQVTVTFRSKADRYVLEVADDGIGMPAESSRSLGLTLVQMLSSQLDATLNVERSHGTHVRVDFPSEPRPGVA
jgi:two-component sensor histidine kinase